MDSLNLTAVGLRGTTVIGEKESDSSEVAVVGSDVNGLLTCCIEPESGMSVSGGSFKSALLSGDKLAERRSEGGGISCPYKGDA